MISGNPKPPGGPEWPQRIQTYFQFACVQSWAYGMDRFNQFSGKSKSRNSHSLNIVLSSSILFLFLVHLYLLLFSKVNVTDGELG